jgi:hypothetical protein
VGFIQLHRQVAPIGMSQVALWLLCQDHLAHLQIHLLHAQEGPLIIQRPIEGFMPFELGARGAHQGEVVPLGGTHMGATSITARTCLPECASEGLRLSSHTMMAPSRLSSSTSQARSWSCNLTITAEEGANEGIEALHQAASKG